jgi:hypothetical protein
MILGVPDCVFPSVMFARVADDHAIGGWKWGSQHLLFSPLSRFFYDCLIPGRRAW